MPAFSSDRKNEGLSSAARELQGATLQGAARKDKVSERPKNVDVQ